MGNVYMSTTEELARYLAEQKLRFFGRMPLSGVGQKIGLSSTTPTYDIELNYVSTDFISRVDVFMYYNVQEIVITIPSHRIMVEAYETAARSTCLWEFVFEPVELNMSLKLKEFSENFREARQVIIDKVKAHINEEVNRIMASEKITISGSWKLSSTPIKVDFKWVSAL